MIDVPSPDEIRAHVRMQYELRQAESAVRRTVLGVAIVAVLVLIAVATR